MGVQGSPVCSVRDRVVACCVIGFCCGFFILLTGLFWVEVRSLYSRLFYWLVALPVCALLFLRPECALALFRSLFGRTLIVFLLYFTLSVCWASPEENVWDLVRRPILVLFLFFGVAFVVQEGKALLLSRLVVLAAACAVVAAAYGLFLFSHYPPGERFSGYGALSNPLLVSHVFGFYFAYWYGQYVTYRTALNRGCALLFVTVLGLLLLATGARTPMVGLAAVVVCGAFMRPSKWSFAGLGVLVCLALGVALLYPNLFLQRGLSYRTDIWMNVLSQIFERPWLGFGLGTPLVVQLPDIPYPFSDPHNMTLSVLYHGGITGCVLWLVMYAVGFWATWRQRNSDESIVFMLALIYGVMATMTEGGSFISRPKEHWLLIWVPMALLFASQLRSSGLAEHQAK